MPGKQPTDPPSFAAFARSTLPFDLHEWQERILCPLIERLATERGLRVLFHAGPQYGKSILLSQRAPAYLLGVDPTHRVGLAAYNETHASGFGAVVRDLMLTPEYQEMFPGEASRVRKDAAEGRFFTQARKGIADGQPSFIALGLLSGFVGKGVDTLIIDDPYKSADEARSQLINDKVWRFWRDTAGVRIGEQANVVVMFHRYHEDDLAGRLLKEGGWEYIRLPAIADDNEDGADPTGRAPGDLLSPMRSREWLEMQRRTNPRTFEGQFQGRPRTDEGGIFKQAWFKYFEEEGEFYLLHRDGGDERILRSGCWCFATVDWAATDKTSADWTVVATWAVTPRGQRLLLDVARVQMEGPEVKALVRNAARRHRLQFIAVEKNGLGLPLTQDLVREGYPVRGVWQHTQKMARAQGSAAYYETGSVFHRQGAEWVAEWEREHLLAPNPTSHDDQVDAGSLAAQVVTPDVEVFSGDWNGSTHAKAGLAYSPSRPLVCGWSFLGGWPAWVVAQLDGSGQLLVVGALKGARDEGVWEFGAKVLRFLGNDSANLDLRHFAHPAHCGVSGVSRPYADAWLTLAAGVQSVKGYTPGGRVIPNGKPSLTIRLAPVGEPRRERLEEGLRHRLNSLVHGLPGFQADPETAGPVVEALSGGYRYKQNAAGLPGEGVDLSTADAAVAEALCCAIWGLQGAAPRSEEDWGPELAGTASGAGRKKTG